MESNNAECIDELRAIKDSIECYLLQQVRKGDVDIDALETWCKAVVKRINAALAAPPRQCDVGTVEEQKERFDAFCNAQPLKRGYCDCVLQKNRQGLCEGLCEFAWAQTSYAEEGARK